MSAPNSIAPIAVYFHWPFCLSKCPYCDFNVHVVENLNHAAWRNAYLRAINHYADMLPPSRAVSVFFGGGTPSLMDPETVGEVIAAVKAKWSGANNIEVTLEANPTSVEIEKFRAFREAGVTRVSIGVQSLNDADLKFLGRKHSAAQALKAIETAREVFDRYSFDLIYARPNQTLDAWREELARAVKLGSAHMSLYQLTIERSTPFYLDEAQGKFRMPGEDLAAGFFEATQEIMEGAGLPAYEVSNHAAPGHESVHNKIYWEYGDYVGIGPGAHGRISLHAEKYATREHSAPDIWLAKINADGFAHNPFQKLSPRERFLEALMMGLRLREGVPIVRLEKEGAAPLENFIDMKRMETLVRENILFIEDGMLRLTQGGMMRLNAVVPFLLKA